jgi:hypothetical protein
MDADLSSLCCTSPSSPLRPSPGLQRHPRLSALCSALSSPSDPAVLCCCPAQKPRIESSDSARWSFAHFRADASRPVPAPPRSNELHHRQFPLPCCFPPSLPSSAAAQFLFTPARQCSAHPRPPPPPPRSSSELSCGRLRPAKHKPLLNII